MATDLSSVRKQFDSLPLFDNALDQEISALQSRRDSYRAQLHPESQVTRSNSHQPMPQQQQHQQPARPSSYHWEDYTLPPPIQRPAILDSFLGIASHHHGERHQQQQPPQPPNSETAPTVMASFIQPERDEMPSTQLDEFGLPPRPVLGKPQGALENLSTEQQQQLILKQQQLLLQQQQQLYLQQQKHQNHRSPGASTPNHSRISREGTSELRSSQGGSTPNGRRRKKHPRVHEGEVFQEQRPSSIATQPQRYDSEDSDTNRRRRRGGGSASTTDARPRGAHAHPEQLHQQGSHSIRNGDDDSSDSSVVRANPVDAEGWMIRKMENIDQHIEKAAARHVIQSDRLARTGEVAFGSKADSSAQTTLPLPFTPMPEPHKRKADTDENGPDRHPSNKTPPLGNLLMPLITPSAVPPASRTTQPQQPNQPSFAAPDFSATPSAAATSSSHHQRQPDALANARDAMLDRVDQIQLNKESEVIRNRVVDFEDKESFASGPHAMRAMSHVAAANRRPNANLPEPIGGYGSVFDRPHTSRDQEDNDMARWHTAKVRNDFERIAEEGQGPAQLRTWAEELPSVPASIRGGMGANPNSALKDPYNARKKWTNVSFALPQGDRNTLTNPMESLAASSRDMSMQHF